MSRRLLAALVAFAFVGAACGGDDPQPEATPTDARDALQAFVASYDLAANRPARVMVGLVTGEQKLLSHGTVSMEFAYMGTEAEPLETPEPGPTAEASFLPVPGEEQAAPQGEGPEITEAARARGVYEADGVRFDRAGFWELRVRAEVEGRGPMEASAAFEVREEPAVPAPGDEAPRTENLTLASDGVPRAAIDSRAAQGGEVPDRELHQTTIAEAIEQGRPALVLFSTPVYCVSRFCGPVTDVIHTIAEEHEGNAAFIHVEIWRDFQQQVVNDAAAEWLLRDGDLQEPWLFLIGPDGRILERWDNVFDPADVEAALATVSG